MASPAAHQDLLTSSPEGPRLNGKAKSPPALPSTDSPQSQPANSHGGGAAAVGSTYVVTPPSPPASSSPPAQASPIRSPPYWLVATGNRRFHGRTPSNVSQESFVPDGAITLQDNEDDGASAPQSPEAPEDSRLSSSFSAAGAAAAAAGGWRSHGSSERGRASWAKSVEVTNYVIVNGSATNIGAFVVWIIRVETLSGPSMNIRKRYSEFDDFRRHLMETFPGFEAAVPELPPKSIIGKFRPRFLERRRTGLQYFLNCILLNPEFSGSPVLKEFLFS